MSETSRYLLLERKLRRTAAPTEPDHDCPCEGEAAAPTAPASVAVATSVRAFDDGRPIDLRYDSGAFCQAPAAPPAAAPRSAPPPPATAAPPPPLPAPPPPPAPTAPAQERLAAATSADLQDDDDFAAHLRSLVEAAGAPEETQEPQPQPQPQPAPEPAPAAPAEEHRYGVFERIGEALAAPRTFDLGSVPVTAAFDAIERSMDRHEGRRPAPAPVEPAPPPPLEDMDLIEDLSLMPPARSASWVGFSPGRADSLVVDSLELDAPPGVSLKNWSAPGVSQFLNKPQQRTRAKSEVRQIVIHETVSPQWGGLHDPALGVQFHLDRDGTLVQHNDVLDMLWHIKTFSERSVGIEVVNLVFDSDAQPNSGEPDPGSRIPVAWGGHLGTHYVVPPLAQMEALAATVGALRSELSIPDNWIQVMQHPDPAKAAATPDRWYFVLDTGGHVYFKNMVDEPWIGSHSVLRDHADGAFPTLYCYLRLRKAMTPDNAYAMAQQVAEDPGNQRRETYFDAASGATLQMLDITDVV